MNKTIIDSQEFTIFSKGELNLLEKNLFGGLPIMMANFMNRELEIAREYDELKFALYKLTSNELCWNYCIVVKLDSGWQRVFIEYLTCTHCNIKCVSANQAMYDLYMLVPDLREVYTKACSLPLSGCYNCGQPLPRPSVWNMQKRCQDLNLQ